MGNKLYEENSVQNIANSIRKCIDTGKQYKIREMSAEIDTINKAYNPFLDKIGYSYSRCENSLEKSLKVAYKEGYLKQKIYKGNQLLDVFDVYGNTQETFTFENDVLTITQNPNTTYGFLNYRITDLIKNNPNKTLNFNYESIDYSQQKSPNNTLVQLRINRGSSDEYIILVDKKGERLNYTIPNDTSDIVYVNFGIFTNNNSTTLASSKLVITKPLLYFDNNDEYEPFVNRKPSPNPEYPQEIRVFDGVENLFDKENAVEKAYLNNLIETDEKYTLNSIGEIVNIYNNNNHGRHYMNKFYLEKGAYTVSYIPRTSGTNKNIRYSIKDFDNNVDVIGSTAINIVDNQKTSFTFTISKSGNVALMLISNNAEAGTLTISDLQITKGDKEQPYVPYKNDKYYNLFDKDNTNNLLDAYLYASTRKITSNVNSKTLYIPCKSNTTYTISRTVIGNRFTVGTTRELPEIDVDIDDMYPLTAGNREPQMTITTNEYAKYICVFYYNAANSDGHTEEELRNSIVIQEGNEIVPYHTNYAVVKNEGKNLFDKDNASVGFISLTTGVQSTNENWKQSEFIEVKPNDYITIGCDREFQLSYYEFSYYDKEKKWLSSEQGSTSISKSLTKRTPNNCYYIKAGYRVQYILEDYNIIILSGSTLENYEPYRETTYTRIPLNNNFLAKIGDVKDEIDFVSGELRKRLGNVVLNGSESWKLTNGVPQMTTTLVPNVADLSTINAYCSHFVYKYYDYSITQRMQIGEFGWNTAKQLTVKKDNSTTIDDFKNWLAQNRPEVYYQLETLQTINLGKSQINMFNGTNILSLINDDENTFSITYYKK